MKYSLEQLIENSIVDKMKILLHQDLSGWEIDDSEFIYYFGKTNSAIPKKSEYLIKIDPLFTKVNFHFSGRRLTYFIKEDEKLALSDLFTEFRSDIMQENIRPRFNEYLQTLIGNLK